MYPAAQVPVNSLNSGYDLPSQPSQPSGIASRIAGLQKTCSDAASLAYQVKAALGISTPDCDAKTTQQPSSLAEAITDVERRLIRAASDLQDVLQHLNS
jgi:hypothetical protein